jgi:aminopeptidase
MHDPRFDRLAAVLTEFSTRLAPGERVLIEAFDVPDEIVVALIRAVRRRRALPYVGVHRARIARELLRGAEKAQYETLAKIELARMKQMDAYIALRGADNIFESSDVPAERMNLAMKILRPVQNWRVQKTKWVVLRWPTPSMAQQAQMSTEQFEDFYFRVCTLDYARLTPGMNALKKLMERTDRVEITGPGTELRFSIKGIGVIPCGGLRNIPDGEIFTAPVRDSVEGSITYNCSTVYQGVLFDQVRLVFQRGRIVEATCNGDNRRLNAILDSDPGARYIGEFALGFNPHIQHPMRDTLFDEKIAGSFHFTPGQAYDSADNGNRSQVHWDIVSIQRPEYGGGEIRFDGKLVRKDGLFVVKGPDKLNPDHLLRSE